MIRVTADGSTLLRHRGLPGGTLGELAGELRAIARNDERASRDERRLLNRLRADLLTVYRAALRVAGEDLGAPTVLRLLERHPSEAALRAAGRDELDASPTRSRSRWPPTRSPRRRT